MTWNYRIIRHTTEYGKHFSLHEVFYDDLHKPEMVTEQAIAVEGFETTLQLMGALIMMVRDVWRSRHDILNYDDF